MILYDTFNMQSKLTARQFSLQQYMESNRKLNVNQTRNKLMSMISRVQSNDAWRQTGT